MLSEEDISIIDAYLNKELREQERADFEARMGSDVEFSKLVEEHRLLVSGIEAFAGASMLATVKADMSAWKEGGYDTYKPPSSGGQIFLKMLLPLGVIAFAVAWYLNHSKQEVTPQTLPPVADTTWQQEADVAPPPESQVISPNESPSSEKVNLVRLKMSATEVADIKLDIKDATTFFVTKLGGDDGIYIYKVEFDGTTQIVKSDNPNLDKQLLLMKEAHLNKGGASDVAK
ncbi:MAG: hypothetical protein ACI8ZN_000239 [Bacteroidia bacterium]|jgi:hypothetical protein